MNFVPLSFEDLMKLLWHTANRCEAGHCVEVAHVPDGRVAVRDSKNHLQAPLVLSPEQWDEFLAGARRGNFG